MRNPTRDRLFLPLLLAALLLPVARAADAPAGALTLEEAMREARLRSPELRRAQAAEDEAAWKRLEAISGHLPKITFNANHLFDVKYQVLAVSLGGPPFSFPEVYPQTTYEIDATWTVFDGLKTFRTFQAAQREHDATEFELTRTQLQLDETIRQRFYEALAAQALDDVARENVKTLEDHLSKTKDVVRAGQATRFDLLRVQVQLEEAAPELQAAEDNLTISRRALSQAIGTEDFSRPLAGSLPEPQESQLVAATAKLTPEAAIQGRDDVRALVARADASDSLSSAALAEWIPQVNLFAQKQWYNNSTFSLTQNFNDAYAVGIALTWNIFEGGAGVARRHEASAREEQARARADALVLATPNEIEQSRRRFTTDLALYRARKRAIEAAEESVRLAKLGFQAGTRTSTDVLDAELDLFRARAGVVRAQLDSATALISLELAAGQKLPERNSP